MAFSIATLGSGSALLLTLAYVDIGLAISDILIQTFKEELESIPEGITYLKEWDDFYLYAGLATAAPSLVLGGAKLLFRLGNLKFVKILAGMLRKTLLELPKFP